MLHFTMTGNTAINNMCERMINRYLEKMPDGKIVNLHNDAIDQCCGIALLTSGKVVALYPQPLCTLKSLLYDRDAEMLSLSPWAISDLSHNTNQTWEEAVEEHNAIRDKLHKTDDIIIAYYIFDHYEDRPKEEDEVDKIDEAFANMHKKFMKRHEERMQTLQDAINSLNDTLNHANDDEDDSLSQQFDQIGKELDDLLDSLKS